VRQLQAHYKALLAVAQKPEVAGKFSPDWYQRAEAMAKLGEEALAAGRLVEANESLRRALWNLPGIPASLPPHVARIFGDGRLRHTY